MNWQALAQPEQTVVFYMGVAQIDAVVAALLQHGLPPTHPAALIERATWPEQRVLHCSLVDLPHTARTAEVQSPSLLILGEVTAAALAGVALAMFIPLRVEGGVGLHRPRGAPRAGPPCAGVGQRYVANRWGRHCDACLACGAPDGPARLTDCGHDGCSHCGTRYGNGPVPV
jgi:hypothetical protein